MSIRDKLHNGNYINKFSYRYGTTYKEEDRQIRERFKHDLLEDLFGDRLSQIPEKAQNVFWGMAWRTKMSCL